MKTKLVKISCAVTVLLSVASADVVAGLNGNPNQNGNQNYVDGKSIQRPHEIPVDMSHLRLWRHPPGYNTFNNHTTGDGPPVVPSYAPATEATTGPVTGGIPIDRGTSAAEAVAIMAKNEVSYCEVLRPAGGMIGGVSGPIIDPNNYPGSTPATMPKASWQIPAQSLPPLMSGTSKAEASAKAWKPDLKGYDPSEKKYPTDFLDEEVLNPAQQAVTSANPIEMADKICSALADTQALMTSSERIQKNSGFYLEQELVKRNIVNEQGLMKGLPGVNLDGLDLLTPLRQEEGLQIRTSLNDGLVTESMIRSACAGATGASKRACDQFLSWNEEYRAATIQADRLHHSGSREYQDAMTAIAAAQNQLREFRKAFSAGNADISVGLGGLVRNLRQVDLNSTTRSQTPEQVERAVLQTTQEARGVLALPTVTAQFEQSAAQYIRDQLDLSDRMAHESVSLAATHGSPSLIRHLGTLASDVGHSSLAFLNGLNHGMGHGLVKAADAMRAIWNNPTLITHLSVDIMNTVTAGPGAVIDAGNRGLELVSSALFEFEMTMLYGSAEQRGAALGEFGSTVLLSMVGGEAALGSRAVIEGAVAKMAEAGATEAIGTALNRTLRASEALAPEMAAIDQKVAQIGESARSLAHTNPDLGRKLDYVLGKATGSAHNVERSQEMLRQMERIGFPESQGTRIYLADHLKKTFNDSTSILRIQENGRVVRESLLNGPRGTVKVESIWEDAKLITVKIFGGGQ